ncbi:hypothetical protein DFP73DRAFT_600316 [Morchella snyderi]|nr:hypothetical protein DFP73DRAFT_600316 [Morchella snyderi]
MSGGAPDQGRVYPRKRGEMSTLDDVATNRTSGQGLPPTPQNALEPIMSSIPERDQYVDTEMGPNTRVNYQQPKQEQASCSDRAAFISLRESMTGHSCQTSNPREAHQDGDQSILAHDFALGFSSSSNQTEKIGLEVTHSELSPEGMETQISRTGNNSCRTELQPLQETATEHPLPVDKVSPSLEDPITCTSTVAYPDHHPGNPGHISLGALTTNGLIWDWPQKQHSERLPVVSAPRSSGEDMIQSHSKPTPYLIQENKATALSQRLEEFKIETEFQGDSVLQRVGTWESGSSTKLWRTSRWKKKTVIGSGSFGTVWLQQREDYDDENEKVGGGVGQLRAVKTVPRDLSQGASLSQELLAFVKLKQFGHLFVNFDGWYEDSENMFLVMEYIREGDLSHYIQRSKEGSKGSRSLVEVKEITRQILEGLEVLHSKRIYHRDLKPENVLMASLDPVWIKIADFGVSKLAKNTSLRTRAGTQGYLAPEILGCNPKKFKTRGLIPHALDIWSLGCLVYELIAFEPPFLDQEPEEEDEAITGVEAWPTAGFREIDFASLREYCHYGLEFPAELLKQPDLPAGEEEEAFIRGLLVPNPMARPTASSILESPWLMGLDYTTSRTEFWKNEFLQLGVGLDFGRDNILMRQVDEGDIYEFLPRDAERSVLDLLLVAVRNNGKDALDRLLKSPSCLKSVDSADRAQLFREAIEAGQRDVVKTLLQREAFFEGSFGDKPMQEWAVGAAADDGEMVKLILEHTSDLWGALLLAVKSGNVDIVRIVLERDPEMEVFGTGNPQLHIPLREAVEKGYLDIIKFLLNEDVEIDMPGPDDAGGRTLLQIAAANGHVEVVNYLLQKGANVNGSPGKNGGRTALQAASGLGHVEIINLLLRNNANVNYPAASANGRTALQAAVEHVHMDAIKLLLDSGANVNGSAGAKSGKTALQAAARCGNLEIRGGRRALQMACIGGSLAMVKLLLNNGADIDSRAGRYGKTALQVAVEVSNMDILKLLLEQKADVNAAAGGESEDERMTALQTAALNGYFEMVKILIDANAHVNAGAVGKHGLTALQTAAKGGDLGILKLLLESGADASAGDKAGWTALSTASGGGHIDIVQLLLENYEYVKPYKTAALKAASRNGHVEIVKLLLYHGADACVKRKVAVQQLVSSDIVQLDQELGPKLLQEAASSGNIDAVKLILDNGVAISTVKYEGGSDLLGLTPLFGAVRGGHIAILKQLLDNISADASTAGPPPYYWSGGLVAAATGGHLEIVKLLLNWSSGASTERSGNASATWASISFEQGGKVLGWCKSLDAASRAEHINVIGYLLDHAICRQIFAHESRFNSWRGFAVEVLRTALSHCIKRGRPELLELILHAHNNEETLNEALKEAARAGNIGIVRLLLTRGGAVASVGKKALEAAAQGGNIKIFRLFLTLYNQLGGAAAPSHGGRAKQEGLQTSLKQAIRGGHSAIVKFLLAQDGVDPAGGLGLAADTGNIEIARLFLEWRSDVGTWPITTALSVAASRGHTGVVRLLLRHKADVNTPTPSGEHLMTPLEAACKAGSSETVFLLLRKGHTIKRPSQTRPTALYHAARRGHTGIVKLLLLSGADINGGGQLLDKSGDGSHLDIQPTPAFSGGDDEGAVQSGRLDPFGTRNTAAQSGGRFGNTLDLPINPFTSKPSSSRLPDAAELPAMIGDINIVRYLLERYGSATVDDGQTTAQTMAYEDALAAAAAEGHTHIVKLLLDYGIDPNKRPKHRKTALMTAALKGHTAIVKLLLEKMTARLTDETPHGEEALLAAAWGGNINIIRLLLDRKVKVNSGRPGSVTALHAAAEIGHIGILKLLIHSKADVNAVTRDGTTVLICVLKSQNADAIKFLVNLKSNTYTNGYGASLYDHSDYLSEELG